MEKSIEKIWKEGFTNSNLSAIPRIDNLDDLKSIYFIDQFKKMYKTNIVVLSLTGILVLFAFIVGDIPFIGCFIFAMFQFLAILGYKELSKLNQLNLGNSNFEFLKSFDHWLKNLLHKFSKIYKIWIPLVFIAFTLGLLQTNLFISFIGETLIERIANTPNLFTFNELSILWFSGILAIAIILSYFSTLIFKREMKSIYGDVLSRLEQQLAEMEELN